MPGLTFRRDRQKLKRLRVRASPGVSSVTAASRRRCFAAEADKPFAAPQVAERVADTERRQSRASDVLAACSCSARCSPQPGSCGACKTFGKFGSGPIEIIADVSLGAKERAVLVQVGGKQLLLGVAPGRVNTLHVLDEPVATGDGYGYGTVRRALPTRRLAAAPGFQGDSQAESWTVMTCVQQ